MSCIRCITTARNWTHPKEVSALTHHRSVSLAIGHSWVLSSSHQGLRASSKTSCPRHAPVVCATAPSTLSYGIMRGAAVCRHTCLPEPVSAASSLSSRKLSRSLWRSYRLALSLRDSSFENSDERSFTVGGCKLASSSLISKLPAPAFDSPGSPPHGHIRKAAETACWRLRTSSCRLELKRTTADGSRTEYADPDHHPKQRIMRLRPD